MKSTIGRGRDEIGPTKDAFFHAAKAGLRAESAAGKGEWGRMANNFADKPDVISMMTAVVQAEVIRAEEVQERLTTGEWMTALAQSD